MTKNLSEARKKLISACEGYIKHNQRELDGLEAKSYQNPNKDFFEKALDKETPDPGFRDWICCQYYGLLDCILYATRNFISPYEYYNSAYKSHTFPEIKWWFKIDNYREDYKKYDQSNPEIVLHNFTALINYLNF